jgi:transposase InsO family protein
MEETGRGFDPEFRAKARLTIVTWIAGFHSTRRRHSAVGGLPPIVYEQRITAARAATTAAHVRRVDR